MRRSARDATRGGGAVATSAMASPRNHVWGLFCVAGRPPVHVCGPFLFARIIVAGAALPVRRLLGEQIADSERYDCASDCHFLSFRRRVGGRGSILRRRVVRAGKRHYCNQVCVGLGVQRMGRRGKRRGRVPASNKGGDAASIAIATEVATASSRPVKAAQGQEAFKRHRKTRGRGKEAATHKPA